MLSRSRASLGLLLTLVPTAALADRPTGVCANVDVDFVPTDQLQIVAWLEKPDGTFVDTIYITNKTGRYGLGNRPGRADFNTGLQNADMFPYGRRINTFPVWAHRNGQSFPVLVFQDGDDDTLSHMYKESSLESVYCRPYFPGEKNFDSMTCATALVFTDKGKFSADTSGYPPRSDVARNPDLDDPAVDKFRELNPFDAVSHPTPVGGTSATMSWPAPLSVDYGDYVVFVETSKTYDFNATYNEMTFPAPVGIPFSNYGTPWRGQPSVVYKVPITLSATPTKALTDHYVGYGSPTGEESALNPPDATITTTTPGSGAGRLQLVSDGGDMYRVRVRTSVEIDSTAPDAIRDPQVTVLGPRSATLAFNAPGDDGVTGTVTGYDIRVRTDKPITADNFADSTQVTTSMQLAAGGTLQNVELSGLLPETDYYVGIQPYDNCGNRGSLVTTELTTAAREVAEVDWCFVATAAYGSAMAQDVQVLRRFRDTLLESTVIGELAVETYYTFGPAVAGVVGESEMLRATARSILAPIIAAVRQLPLINR